MWLCFVACYHAKEFMFIPFLQLAQRGLNLVLLSRSAEKLNSAAEEISKQGISFQTGWRI